MKKRHSCLKTIFMILFAFLLLYFVIGGGKEKILKILYPVKYSEYVEQYSQEYGLDRFLVYAVIRTESEFDPDAVSSAGAKGLMQLMDKTADECNRKEGFGYKIPEDLYVPEKNIRIGCFYLRSLINIHKDMELAVTAYNGGTGNVGKWLKDENLSDGDGGLSDIPYAETREYVQKVMNAYDMYIKLYK